MRGLAVLVALFGIGFLGTAHDEWKLGKTYELEPRAIRPGMLGDVDENANRHVRLSHFRLLLDETIYTFKREGGPWTSVYVPVAHSGSGLELLVTSKKVRSEDDLAELAARTELEGLLVTGVKSVDTKAAEMLAESFPTADLATVALLDIDRHVPGSPGTNALLGLGLLIGSVFLWRR